MHFTYIIININCRSKQTNVVIDSLFLFSGPFYVLYAACSKDYDVDGSFLHRSFLPDNRAVELLCSQESLSNKGPLFLKQAVSSCSMLVFTRTCSS